jgi:hypothetical protein
MSLYGLDGPFDLDAPRRLGRGIAMLHRLPNLSFRPAPRVPDRQSYSKDWFTVTSTATGDPSSTPGWKR